MSMVSNMKGVTDMRAVSVGEVWSFLVIVDDIGSAMHIDMPLNVALAIADAYAEAMNPGPEVTHIIAENAE